MVNYNIETLEENNPITKDFQRDEDDYPHYICPKGHRNDAQCTVTGFGEIDGQYCNICFVERQQDPAFRFANAQLALVSVPRIVQVEPPKHKRFR